MLIMKVTDNIGFAVRKIENGETVSDLEGRVSLQAKEEIPFGFKVALRNIEKGSVIYKFGEPMGKAKQPVACGHLVHVHNIAGLHAHDYL